MIPPDDEIDLHDCMPYEVRMKLLPFLDQGYADGWDKVHIIHGKGEGVLRRVVWDILDELEYIDQYQLASIYEGGQGKTIAIYDPDSP